MVINPIVGVYIAIIRIPIKGGMTIPNIATFDHGTYMFTKDYYFSTEFESSKVGDHYCMLIVFDFLGNYIVCTMPIDIGEVSLTEGVMEHVFRFLV